MIEQRVRRKLEWNKMRRKRKDNKKSEKKKLPCKREIGGTKEEGSECTKARPKSAYLLFCDAHRSQIRQQNESILPLGQLTARCPNCGSRSPSMQKAYLDVILIFENIIPHSKKLLHPSQTFFFIF
jgi:hypothetical protein